MAKITKKECLINVLRVGIEMGAMADLLNPHVHKHLPEPARSRMLRNLTLVGYLKDIKENVRSSEEDDSEYIEKWYTIILGVYNTYELLFEKHITEFYFEVQGKQTMDKLKDTPEVTWDALTPELKSELDSHDYYAGFSDSHAVYKRWTANGKRIRELIGDDKELLLSAQNYANSINTRYADLSFLDIK